MIFGNGDRNNDQEWWMMGGKNEYFAKCEKQNLQLIIKQKIVMHWFSILNKILKTSSINDF